MLVLMTHSVSASTWVCRVYMLARRCYTDHLPFIIHRQRLSITSRRPCITSPMTIMGTTIGPDTAANMVITGVGISMGMGMGMTAMTTIDRRQLHRCKSNAAGAC